MHGNSPYLKRAAHSETPPGPSARSRRSQSHLRSNCCSFFKPNRLEIKIRDKFERSGRRDPWSTICEEFFQTPQNQIPMAACGESCGGSTPGARAEVVRASLGAHPRGHVADRATRRAERRCATFSAAVDELVAGLRVDIDEGTATWRVWQWEQARDCGRDRICAARVCTQLLSTDISDQTWLRHSK